MLEAHICWCWTTASRPPPPSPPLAEAWLARAPQLRLLATSREPLGVRGERTLEIEPLPLPLGDALEAVRASDAAQLYTDRCKALAPTSGLTADNAPTIAALVRMLDGLPLAIELAAGRAGELDPKQTLAALQQRFALLQSDERDRVGRHRTLQAALDWSWALLDDDDKRTLATLSTFAGSLTTASAAAVLQIDEGAAVRTLDGLVKKHLVRERREGRAEERRFDLLVSVRDYAEASAGRPRRVRRGRGRGCPCCGRATRALLRGDGR